LPVEILKGGKMRKVIAVICLTVLAVSFSYSSEEQEGMKAVYEKSRESVVTIKVVVSTTIEAQGREKNKIESKMETQGVVLNEEGLTAVTYSTLDLVKMLSKWTKGIKAKCDINSVKIILGDDKEIPSKLILIDKELDIAFVRPEKNDIKFKYMEAGKVPAPEITENVYALFRMPQDQSRELIVYSGFICAKYKKIHNTYICSALPLGSIIFNKDKKFYGLITAKTDMASDSGESSQSSLDSISDTFKSFAVSYILPVETILDTAEQIKKAEKKDPK
jgi:hypothetical protein